jgi:hypothetical protein
MPPRVEELNELPRLRVHTCDIGALETIAIKTRQAQILWDRPAAVLSGNDVVDLESEQRACLRHLAILATGIGALPDEADKLLFHGPLSTPVFLEDDTRLRPQEVHEVADAPVTLEFFLLSLRQAAFLALDGQRVHAVAVFLVEIQL